MRCRRERLGPRQPRCYVRGMRIVCGALLLATTSLAIADDVSPQWTELDNKQLGIHVRYPPRMTKNVKGSQLVLVGKDLPTVTIAVTSTTDRSTSKSGGVHDHHVDWTITVPKRSAQCSATGADDDQAQTASHICDSLVLQPAPRTPHVDLTVESTGLADAAAYERAVRATQPQVDRCWKAAVAKDADMPEGAVEL